MLGQAAHRRIGQRQATCVRCRIQTVRGERVDGAHVHQQCTGLCVREHAACAEAHGFDLGRRWQHGDDDPALARDVRNATPGLGASGTDGDDCVRVDIVHQKVKPFFDQVDRHRAAHAAEADETDFFRSSI